MVYLAISKLEGQCRPQPAQADMIGKERERERVQERGRDICKSQMPIYYIIMFIICKTVIYHKQY